MFLTKRLHLIALLPLVAFTVSGCDLTRFTANSTADIFGRGASGLEQHWDYELVGDAMPGNILQVEGIFSIVPDNEALGITLMKAYLSYAFGWVEDEMQQAQDAGSFEGEERLMGRTRLLYERGLNVGLHLMRLRDPGIDDAMSGGHAGFVEYIESHYTAAEDVPLIFWTGYAWGSAINAGRDDPEMILNLPLARSLMEHAASLDRSYYTYGSVTFLAVINASLPPALGGDPDRARELFEEALASTDRKFFTVQLSYARTYAVQVQDRDLFIRLLREVIDGGDPEPSARLANRIARRRAIRWMRRIDQLF